jgi:hypothetical protein
MGAVELGCAWREDKVAVRIGGDGRRARHIRGDATVQRSVQDQARVDILSALKGEDSSPMTGLRFLQQFPEVDKTS